MHKYLREDSTLVQQGSALSSLPWLIGDGFAVGTHPILGGCMIAASLAGFCFGQTQTGVVSQYGLAFAGYTSLLITGLHDHNVGEVISAIGGMIATGRTVADNYTGSVFYRLTHKEPYVTFDKEKPDKKKNIFRESIDTITALPTSILQWGGRQCEKSSNPYIQQFGKNIQEVTERSMFKGAFFGAICDTGYVISGIANGLTSQIVSGLFWLGGYTLTAISKPKDGQKNIYRTWAENAWDCMRGKKSATTDNKPQPK